MESHGRLTSADCFKKKSLFLSETYRNQNSFTSNIRWRQQTRCLTS